jgi:hypothetical protein
MTVIEEIAAERRRQIEVEGWTAGHDDSEHADAGRGRTNGGSQRILAAISSAPPLCSSPKLSAWIG